MHILEFVKSKGIEVRFHGRAKNEASHYCGQCEVSFPGFIQKLLPSSTLKSLLSVIICHTEKWKALSAKVIIGKIRYYHSHSHAWTLIVTCSYISVPSVFYDICFRILNSPKTLLLYIHSSKSLTFCSFGSKKSVMWFIVWVVRANNNPRYKVSCVWKSTSWVN